MQAKQPFNFLEQSLQAALVQDQIADGLLVQDILNCCNELNVQNVIPSLARGEVQELFRAEDSSLIDQARLFITARCCFCLLKKSTSELCLLLKKLMNLKRSLQKQMLLRSLSYRSKPFIYWLPSMKDRQAEQQEIEQSELLEQEVAYLLGVCRYGVWRLKKSVNSKELAESLKDVLQLCHVAQTSSFSTENVSQLHWQICGIQQEATLFLRKHQSHKDMYLKQGALLLSILLVYLYEDMKLKDSLHCKRKLLVKEKTPQEKLAEHHKVLIDCRKWFAQNLIKPPYDKTVGAVKQGVGLCKSVVHKSIDGFKYICEAVKSGSKKLAVFACVAATLKYYGLRSYRNFSLDDLMYGSCRLHFQNTLRAVNKLLLLPADSNQRFIIEGKLYCYVSSLKNSFCLLSQDEIVTMHDDIQMLLSFDLAPAEKQDVIKQMYHSYASLKKQL